VQPDRLALQLRPRGGWEALDLGFQMAREWWRPIWMIWLAVYLPGACVCLIVFEHKFYAVMVLWWLKPLFDRAVLHTASRAVFGEIPSARATLRAWREWIGPGLIRDLTLYRLDTARSFALPVSQLEKQKGRAGIRRRAALGRRMRSYAVWLTLACMHLELLAMYSLNAFSGWFAPAAGNLAPDPQQFDNPLAWFESLGNWAWLDVLSYVGAVTLVEPFYVAAGFALYLNRRAILEGWDIELALRRLEERLRSTVRAIAAALTVIAPALTSIAFGALLLLDPGPLHAQEEDPAPSKAAATCPAPEGWDQAMSDPTPARQAADAVFESPEFSRHKDVNRWHYLGDDDDKRKSGPRPGFGEFWRNLSLLLGEIGEKAIWVLAAVVAVLALYYLRGFVPQWLARDTLRYRPPAALFGLDVTPESLPEDIAGAATALAGQGRAREALSLLYRGTLSALIHRHEIALVAGDTESDCLRAVQQKLPGQTADYFSTLVRAWQDVAWAARRPDAAGIDALCRQWGVHFAQTQP
jgi:hypothetical protein